MFKHAPTPWIVDEDVEGDNPDIYIETEQYVTIAEITGGELHHRRANAAHIIACVNACNGINPAAVPALLAALERLLEESCPFECDRNSCECGEHGDGIADDGTVCEHIQARRAIALALSDE